MKVTILGCGTSTGVPIVGCSCEVCTSSDPKDNRLRTSAHIAFNDGMEILIDTGPDLREQALRYGVRNLDAVLITHIHADHIAGIDEIRVHNFIKGGSIDMYGLKDHIDQIRHRFDYIFKPSIQRGGGKPNIVTHNVEGSFEINGITVVPVPLLHGKLDCLGWRIGNFGYLTDVNSIPESSYDLVEGLDVLVIGGLRWRPHTTHYSISESVQQVERIAPKRAFITHMGHDICYATLNAALPENIEPAFDGLTFELDEPKRT